jgi:DNA-binding NarL/FixJ family response regulator
MSGTLSGIVIVAQPGRLLTSLRVLLRSDFPDIPIEQIEDPHTLDQALQCCPRLLVLIDANLPAEEAWRIGGEIRDRHPRHHVVILTHTLRQCDQSSAAGLDALPLEGMTANFLGNAIQDFFPL